MCCEGPSRSWTHVLRFHSKSFISHDKEHRNCHMVSGQARINNANIIVDNACTNCG